MRREQYRQLLDNRRRRGAVALFAQAADAGVLRAAARAQRRRRRADRALESLLPGEWRATLHVDAFEGGVLTLAGSEPRVCEELRRQLPRLGQQLGSRLPGFRRLRVLMSDTASDEAGAGRS